MIHRPRLPRLAALLLLILLPARGHAAEPRPASTPAVEPFLRLEQQPPGVTALQVAVRRLIPADPARPEVLLVGAVHVGDPAFFDQLQRILDAQPVVLYEGVGRPDFADRSPAADTARAARTRSALRFVGGMALWYRQQFGPTPRSLNILRQAARDQQRRESLWLHAAFLDGWGRPLLYTRSDTHPDGFTLTSLGADGQPGGVGPAADLAFADLPGPRWTPGPQAGIQGELAAAMGLVFQLDAIDYDRPNFRHADLSVAQLQRVLAGGAPEQPGNDRLPAAGSSAARPASREAAQMNRLMDLLDGSSGSAALIRVALRFVGASPAMRSVVKMTMAELLGSTGGNLSDLKLPDGMDRLMKVLIEDRNRIVMQELRATLGQQPAPRTVAIFYGAAHMPDLQRRITRELNYRVGPQQWLTAFSASAAESGLGEAELTAVREMIRQQVRMLQQQQR